MGGSNSPIGMLPAANGEVHIVSICIDQNAITSNFHIIAYDDFIVGP